MLQEAIFTTETPRASQHHASSYNDWLRCKVERARVFMRADQGIPNEEVEAEFSARRKQAMSAAGQV